MTRLILENRALKLSLTRRIYGRGNRLETGVIVEASVEVVIDTKNIWTGEPARDAHLRSADFLDVERYPQITFRGAEVLLIGVHECILNGDLTIRGVNRKTSLRVKYLGQWQTPWWEDEVDKGP